MIKECVLLSTTTREGEWESDSYSGATWYRRTELDTITVKFKGKTVKYKCDEKVRIMRAGRPECRLMVIYGPVKHIRIHVDGDEVVQLDIIRLEV